MTCVICIYECGYDLLLLVLCVCLCVTLSAVQGPVKGLVLKMLIPTGHCQICVCRQVLVRPNTVVLEDLNCASVSGLRLCRATPRKVDDT
jgi:hypothetical protein